jgi:simple sugar transport system substrate-binding protein/ribose transport system substrate-binding protein
MNKYVDAGMPVVTFNVDSPSSKRLAYFGQDNYNAGKAQAQELLKYLGANPSGKVAIFSASPDFSSLRDRAQGIQDVLKAYPNVQVLGIFGGGGSDLDKAYAAVENVYTQHPDVKAFLAVDGTSAPALARFMDKEGLKDKVIAGGFDLTTDTLQGIKSGALKWSQGQFPYKQGYDAVKALYDAAHGKPVSSVDAGAEIVDATNISQYLK